MKPLFLIAGPCAIEDRHTPLKIAQEVKAITDRLGITYIFKSSFKKANRTKLDSFTGISKPEALEILRQVREETGVPVLTDVHETWECAEVAPYVDYLQIPAFLCRQTDLLIAAGETGKGVNIKKGQFLSPEAMQFAVEKVRSTGNDRIWLTERGTTFGYESLVVDITSIPRMQKTGCPVVMDCTHSVQKPNQSTGITGGDAQLIGTLCLAAVAAGVDGLFIETHPEPSLAKSDAASMLRLDLLEDLLIRAVKVRAAINS
ncbi:MAG: 3-deoxy-8-phosphooctulonate synthase [Bacteroidia bacterium]|nr:3-deoxy-8-phosphooctulonate synthase [Bacteroidia bacterium]